MLKTDRRCNFAFVQRFRYTKEWGRPMKMGAGGPRLLAPTKIKVEAA
jgi:hypothetical protein